MLSSAITFTWSHQVLPSKSGLPDLCAAAAVAAHSNTQAATRRTFVFFVIACILVLNQRIVSQAELLPGVTEPPAYLVRLNSTKSLPMYSRYFPPSAAVTC